MSGLDPPMEGTPTTQAHSRDVRAFAQGIRRIVLEQSMRAGVGHIGSALSVADIVAALYADVLAASDPRDPDRDRFVLSKGHASLAALRGPLLRDWLTHRRALDATARTAPGSGHTPSTCSRGRLLDRLARTRPLARGRRGARRDASQRVGAARVRVCSATPSATRGRSGRPSCSPPTTGSSISSPSSTSTGSRRSATRATCSISRRSAERWRAFGWDVHEVDGHDAARSRTRIRGLDARAGPPARPGRADRLRQGRLVHGAQHRVALPADDRASSTAAAMQEVAA